MNSKEGEDGFKKRFEELVERYKFWIGGILLFLIFIGSGYLLYRENYSKVSYDERISELENEVIELKNMKTSTPVATAEEVKTRPDSVVTEPPKSESEPTVETGKVAGVSTKNTKPAVSGVVNINTGSETELDSLPGIGATYAKRIIEYRNINGGFKTIDEIKNVKGIGDKTFEKFKDKITVE